MSSRSLLAIGAVLAAAVLFGSTGTAQELGPDAATPGGVGAMRIAVGAIGLWVVAARVPASGALRAAPIAVVAGSVGVALYQPAFFTGTDRLGVALGTIVALASAPAFAGAIELLGGRPPGAPWLVGTAISVGGVALIVVSSGDGARADALGFLAALGAGAGYAAYAVSTKHLIERGVRGVVASAWQFSIGAVLLSPLLVVEPMGWLTEPGGVVMALHLGVVCTTVAYLLYGWGLGSIPTSTATTLTLAEPATAALLAVTVLDERLGVVGWAGVAVVLGGLVLVARARPG